VKRAKFLMLVLIVAIMLIGAGYAIWNEELFLTTTVRTGKFDVEITGVGTRTGDDQRKNEAHDWHKYDWTHGVKANTKVLPDGNSAIVEFKDLYPGGVVQVDMKFENKGTIPAKLKGARVELLSGNEDLFNLLRAQTTWKADVNGDGVKDKWAHVNQDWWTVQRALDKLVESTNKVNLVIEPGGWFTLGAESEEVEEENCILFKLHPDAGNEYQNQYCKFKITFDWEQWAKDPTQNPYDGENGYGGDGDIQEIEGTK